MSKKKKQEQMEAERRAQLRRKKKNPSVVYGSMGGIYPVAPASSIIQLPPIVQPVVMVPFSSQMQPLATFVEDDEDEDWD